MREEQHKDKWITREQMLGFIKGGRAAIERSLLMAVMRSITNTQEAHDAEIADLHALLDLYNKKMARFEYPKIDAEPANDEKGAID